MRYVSVLLNNSNTSFFVIIACYIDLLPKHPSPKAFLFGFREGADVFVVLFPGPAVADYLADDAPFREAADRAVVDEDVGVELAGLDAGSVHLFAGIVAVDCEELDSALLAEVDGILQELAFAGCPENECVSFGL